MFQDLGIIGKPISSVNRIILHRLDLVTEIANTSKSSSCNLNRDQSLVRSSLWSTQGSSGSHGKRELQWSGFDEICLVVADVHALAIKNFDVTSAKLALGLRIAPRFELDALGHANQRCYSAEHF